VFRRRKRRQLLAGVSSSAAPDALNHLTWREFEMLVGEAFRVQGYSVTETAGSADGGVDVVLRKDSEKYFVQCKQWRAHTVGVPIVRELYGAMAAHGATGGFVVTSGRFTKPAIEFAEGRNVTLIDGPQLHAMIQGVSQNSLAAKNAVGPIVPGQTTWLVVNLPAGDRNTDAFASPVRGSSILSISTVNTRPGLADSGRLQGICSAQAVRCGRLPFAAVFACLVSGSPRKVAILCS
jgi:hypothetical protein